MEESGLSIVQDGGGIAVIVEPAEIIRFALDEQTVAHLHDDRNPGGEKLREVVTGFPLHPDQKRTLASGLPVGCRSER